MLRLNCFIIKLTLTHTINTLTDSMLHSFKNLLLLTVMLAVTIAPGCTRSCDENANTSGGTLTEGYGSRHLADSLQNLIEHHDLFVREKELRINELKKIRASLREDSPERFHVTQQLIDEYRKFQADSAIAYARQNVSLARSTGNGDKLVNSLAQLSMILSMTGRFREAESLLDDISPAIGAAGRGRGNAGDSLCPRNPIADFNKLGAGERCAYYEALKCFWDYYSISTNHEETPPVAYKDSLLHYLPKDSYTYRVDQAVSYYPTDSLRTEQEFRKLLDSIPVGTPEYAMLTNYFGSLNLGWGNRERAKQFYRLSAITDLRNATRETASLQALATMEMEEGNLQQAYRLTSRTVDDIMVSGISFRAPEIYNFYSILTSTLREEERKSHSSLIVFICVLTVGVLALALLAFLLYRQMKRIQSIKATLAENNQTLQHLNQQLNESNEKLNEYNGKLTYQNNLLVESNLTKEHYITQFFDVCFSYISKMEKERNLLYKLTVNRSFDQLIKRLQSDASLKEETASLYERFDSVFLRLYPTFINDFNSLLQPGEEITLKQAGILPRDLRIYALLRLGITDNTKISSFLRCSMGTIYNYRNRMRNRAVNRDTFEEDIMKIPSSHEL